MQSPARDGFGMLLRCHRLALGLSQEELADRAGLSVRAIANMEHGRTTRPRRHTVWSLADALGLPESARLHFDRASRVAGSEPAADLEQSPAGYVVPHELPAAVRHFTGREAELIELSELAAAGEVPALVICAVGGTAGVGKTALAVQWAHQAAEWFPEGQLYVNLRGYDPHEPVSAADALAGFLRTLGVPGTDIPDAVEDRSRLFRSRLAGRRVLVLLDNARDGDHVRPLLPGDPGCMAVVTSRDSLSGFAATHGARRLDLDVLPLADAITLLRSLIGPCADADPEAAAELVGLCARLPLALRIAAEQAVARRSTPLPKLVAELEATRLDVLDAGEDRADVRAVFSWSIRQLPDDVAGVFAMISLHPGEDLDEYAAAALTGNTIGLARRILGRLHRASLLQAVGPGRYGMHDLLRDYARELAATRYTTCQSQQALSRLFDYYLAAAQAATIALYPADAHRRPLIGAAAAVLPAMPAETGARAWLDRERANLATVVAHCARDGWPGHAAELAVRLFPYLMTGSHLPEAQTIYGHTLQAARRSGDLTAEAEALNGLGGIGMMKGHFRISGRYYKAALELYRQCGDRASEARILRNLGVTERQLHNYQSAAGYFQGATAAYEEAGDGLGAARAQAGLAGIETELGSYDQASEHLQRALPVLRDANDKDGEAEALEVLGLVNFRRGELTQAAEFFEQALAICRSIDYPTGVASVLFYLGAVSLRQGEYQQAITHLRQAVGLHREAGYQHGEIETLRSLADALHGAGQPAAARSELTMAVQLAAETGNTYQQASAHRELAESHHCAGEDEQARHHRQQALDLYTQLGVPEADEVRSQLYADEARASTDPASAR